jgi:TolB-like protein
VGRITSVLTGAVFLSYASGDAAAAERICTSLRTAGIEVWFDQNELRGGDAWDQLIRKQIKTCVLFVPVISKNTHDRVEGYFRLEWKLAVDRCHLMAADRAFLLPVVIDDTRDDDDRVPERFREVQWTRLPGGATPAAFVEHVRRLLTQPAAARVLATATIPKPVLASWRSKVVLLVTIGLVVVAVGYLVVDRLLVSKRLVEIRRVSGSTAQTASEPAAEFNPSPHSIAVLPFVNISGDKEQEYFSDGLTEELLDSLARINELQVSARTSSFSFKGKDLDIPTVARKLNVAAVLEGSVRRSGHTIRITAQLINAVTGFHLWSQTYDRNLGDVLKLQTEIANAVAGALKVTLLGDVAAKVELGGTHNAAAFDAYLRGRKLSQTASTASEQQGAIAAYTEALRLDPGYALAFADRSIARTAFAEAFASGAAIREGFDQALADAQKSIARAPELGVGHEALAHVLEVGFLDFARANDEYERALELAPGDARILRGSANFISWMGHPQAGIAAARRAVTLDPLNPRSQRTLGITLYNARRYSDAIAANQADVAFEPSPTAYARRGESFYALGDFESARISCEAKLDYWRSQACLAVTYDKLGRHADAEVMLGKLKTKMGDASAYQYAQIYAQWGNLSKALEWLETAWRLRDPGLLYLKTDPLLDPLRDEGRFQTIETALKFPT